MTLLEVAYESAKDRTQASYAQFHEVFKDWQTVPVFVDGEIAGAILIDGPEIHACILPWAHGKWASRRLRPILDNVIAQHGYAKTRANTEAGKRFVQRLGFKLHHDNEYRKI